MARTSSDADVSGLVMRNPGWRGEPCADEAGDDVHVAGLTSGTPAPVNASWRFRWSVVAGSVCFAVRVGVTTSPSSARSTENTRVLTACYCNRLTQRPDPALLSRQGGPGSTPRPPPSRRLPGPLPWSWSSARVASSRAAGRRARRRAAGAPRTIQLLAAAFRAVAAWSSAPAPSVTRTPWTTLVPDEACPLFGAEECGSRRRR